MWHSRSSGWPRRSTPPRRRSAVVDNLFAFPSARNVDLIETLVRQFLALPPGPDRGRTFRATVIASLAHKRRALGLPREVVRADMRQLAATVERYAQILVEATR